MSRHRLASDELFKNSTATKKKEQACLASEIHKI
jgi:hypothetical protein